MCLCVSVYNVCTFQQEHVNWVTVHVTSLDIEGYTELMNVVGKMSLPLR